MPLLSLLAGMCADALSPWALGFQDGASMAPEGISELYSLVMSFRVAIVVGVFYPLGVLAFQDGAPVAPEGISELYSSVVSFRVAIEVGVFIALGAQLAAGPFLFPRVFRHAQLQRMSGTGLPVPRLQVPHLFGLTLALGRILGAMHANVRFAQVVLGFLMVRSTERATVVYLTRQMSNLAPLVFALGLLAGAPAPVITLHSDGETLVFSFSGWALHTYLVEELGCKVSGVLLWQDDLQSRLARQNMKRLGGLWHKYVQRPRSGGRRG